MKAILGKKIGMTQVFDADGKPQPVTLIMAGPCFVTQIKSLEKDKYSSVQIGFDTKKRLTKPLAGHLKGRNCRFLKEFRLNGEGLEVGAEINISQFAVGDQVKISGVSFGRGFAGVIKRHGFSRGPVSHGHPFSRKPGSIGSMYPERVFPGMKMAGRMGNRRCTVKTKILAIDPEKNILAVKGPLPGKRNGLLEIVGV
jgi:large subunit ribosomal protein L3